MFLPAGYYIECSAGPSDSGAGFISVAIPGGRTMQGTAYKTAGGRQALSWSIGPAPVEGEYSQFLCFLANPLICQLSYPSYQRRKLPQTSMLLHIL